MESRGPIGFHCIAWPLNRWLPKGLHITAVACVWLWWLKGNLNFDFNSIEHKFLNSCQRENQNSKSPACCNLLGQGKTMSNCVTTAGSSDLTIATTTITTNHGCHHDRHTTQHGKHRSRCCHQSSIPILPPFTSPVCVFVLNSSCQLWHLQSAD